MILPRCGQRLLKPFKQLRNNTCLRPAKLLKKSEQKKVKALYFIRRKYFSILPFNERYTSVNHFTNMILQLCLKEKH